MPVGVTMKSKGRVPTQVAVGKRFFDQIAQYVEKAQDGRIRAQQRTDGRPIKRNKIVTSERKRKRGQPQISLVDGWHSGKVDPSSHHFVGPNAMSREATKLYARIWLKPESSDIAEHLEARGYTGWWGLAKPDRAAIQRLYILTVKTMVETRARKLGSQAR